MSSWVTRYYRGSRQLHQSVQLGHVVLFLLLVFVDVRLAEVHLVYLRLLRLRAFQLSERDELSDGCLLAGHRCELLVRRVLLRREDVQLVRDFWNLCFEDFGEDESVVLDELFVREDSHDEGQLLDDAFVDEFLR